MNIKEIDELIKSFTNILIVQADNPDGDSLASSLALEALLTNAGKNVSLYCGVEIPAYLRYLDGWDRVQNSIPKDIEMAIIVDTSAISLLESLQKSNQLQKLQSVPCIIIDHHTTKPTIDFASQVYCPDAVSSGEAIYQLAVSLEWPINLEISEFIAYSILSDTLGLSTENVNEKTFLVMADLAKKGVSVAKLNNIRQKLNKKSPRILNYKAELLSRIDYSLEGRVASVVIPFSEIEQFSHEYNPSMLVLEEMRMVEKVLVSVVYKTYPDGKITAKIRTNFEAKIADIIAEHFGGGGHQYAAGFKITDGRSIDQVKKDFDTITSSLLHEHNIRENDETIQHTF